MSGPRPQQIQSSTIKPTLSKGFITCVLLILTGSGASLWFVTPKPFSGCRYVKPQTAGQLSIKINKYELKSDYDWNYYGAEVTLENRTDKPIFYSDFMIGLDLIDYKTRNYWQDVMSPGTDSRGRNTTDTRVIQPHEKINLEISSIHFAAKPGDIVEFHAEIFQFHNESEDLIPAELKRKYPSAIPITEITDTQHYACAF
jgi:hypothetical protein